jgi:subtilisin family serine protease
MRKYAHFGLGIVCLILIVFAMGAARRGPGGLGAGLPDGDGPLAAGTITTPTLWFVEMQSAPLAETKTSTSATEKYIQKLRREKRAFRVAAAAAGIGFRQRYSYDVLWNGVALTVEARDVLALSRLPGVANLYPVVATDAPEPAVAYSPGDSAPELFTAITMTGASEAHAAGWTGAGVRVAIMDTGLDYNHPDLGGGFGPGYRVAGGYDFVGDAYNSSDPNHTTPHPDPDPMDCAGHGTHVAGIVGAKGTVTGVAPDAVLRAYKVFGCVGTTDADVMLAAMERILADGNQVLNMSIGSAFSWPQYPAARGADNLVNRGIVVVASAGNSGANGLYSMSAPGVGKKTIGTASVDNNRVHVPAFARSDGSLVGYAPMSFSPDFPTSGTYPLVNAGRGCTVDGPLPPAVSGSVALMVRGTCSFREKATNARNAGAVAALIYNNSPGLFFGTLGSAFNMPAAGLSREDGLALVAAMPLSITWTALLTDAPNASGGLISSFSAFGLSPDLSLKPDLSAPGGLIFSTLPLAQGGYGLNSGTSMAAPHVAGAAALLLQARPRTNSHAARDILMNSGRPGLWFGSPALGLLENTHRQGAGLLDIDAAIRSTTKITPGKIALGETENHPITSAITVENNADSAVTYELSNAPALATGPNTFAVKFFSADPMVAFAGPNVTPPAMEGDPYTLTVPAGGSTTVNVTVTESPFLANGGIFGGYVVLTPRDGGRASRVPYAGYRGDYQSILVLNPAASKFGNPLLRPDTNLGASGPVTIDPTAKETAKIFFHLDHQVRRLRIEAFDYASGRSYGRLGEFGYIERHPTPDAFSYLEWDGRTRFGLLPDGAYFLRLSIQKALGDDNPGDWETWDSPVITISSTGGEPLP